MTSLPSWSSRVGPLGPDPVDRGKAAELMSLWTCAGAGACTSDLAVFKMKGTTVQCMLGAGVHVELSYEGRSVQTSTSASTSASTGYSLFYRHQNHAALVDVLMCHAQLRASSWKSEVRWQVGDGIPGPGQPLGGAFQEPRQVPSWMLRPPGWRVHPGAAWAPGQAPGWAVRCSLH